MEDTGTYTWRTVFGDREYLTRTKSFPTKSDNANAIHFTRVPSHYKGLEFINACHKSTGFRSPGFRFLTDVPKENLQVLEVILPDSKSCEKVVREGVCIGLQRFFPQLPNGEAFEMALLVRVHNLPMVVTDDELKRELVPVFEPFGMIVLLQAKYFNDVGIRYFQGEKALLLVPTGQSLDSNVKSENWNRVLGLEFNAEELQRIQQNASPPKYDKLASCS